MKSLKEQFCQTLKYFRIQRGLSHQELGDKIGVSGSYISNIENGHKGISLERIEELAYVLGITISFDVDFKMATNIQRIDYIEVDYKGGKEGERNFKNFRLNQYDTVIEAYSDALKYLNEQQINFSDEYALGMQPTDNNTLILAYFQKNGKQVRKYFSINEFGKHKALEKASKFRVNGLINKGSLHPSNSTREQDRIIKGFKEKYDLFN